MDITHKYIKQMEENKIVNIYNVSNIILYINGRGVKPYDMIEMPQSMANTYKGMLGDRIHLIK